MAGVVTDASAVPLADVAVYVSDTNGNPTGYARTAANGSYAVTGLLAAKYTVCFDPADTIGTSSTGYLALCYHQVDPAGTPTSVTAAAGQTTSSIGAQLQPAPAGSGLRRSPAASPLSPAAVVPACSTVLFVGARGSGEPGPGGVRNNPADPYLGLGGTVYGAYLELTTKVQSAGGTTALYSLSYPADDVKTMATIHNPDLAIERYFIDLNLGVARARSYLAARAQDCPNERIVLVGYSQGAMVMHRLLAQNSLSSDILDRVDSTLLIADGDRVPIDTTHFYGSAKSTSHGLGEAFPSISGTGTTKFTSAAGSEVISVCTADDIVCDNHVPSGCGSSSPVLTIACDMLQLKHSVEIHSTYQGSTLVRTAADASAAMLYGTVRAWGQGGTNSLGDGRGLNSTPTPVKVRGLSGVVSVEGGGGSGYALGSDGTLWAWGNIEPATVGVSRLNDSSIAMKVVSATNVKTFAAGPDETFLVKNDGTVWAWGDTFLVKNDGTVWAWGDNRFGGLGNGTTTNSAIPEKIPSLTNVKTVAAVDFGGYALKNDGTVWAWGPNSNGELGTGTTVTAGESLVPVKVPGLAGITRIVAASGGAYALRSDGRVYAWGFGANGQIGNGTTDNARSPILIPGLTNVRSLAKGAGQAYALRSDGTVWGWGLGDLGNGTDVGSKVPIPIPNLNGITQIAVADVTGFALHADGSLFAWGLGIFGTIGDGQYASRLSPVRVIGIGKVAYVGSSSSDTAYCILQ